MYAFLKNRNLRNVFGFVLFVVVLLVIYYLRAVFIPFFVAVLGAYILNPLVNWLESKRINRTLSIISIFVVMAAVFAMLLTFAVPATINQVKDLVMAIQGDEYEDVNGNDKFDEGELVLDRNNNGEYNKSLISKFNEWFLDISSGIFGKFGQSERLTSSIKKSLNNLNENFRAFTEQVYENIGIYVTALFKNTLAFLALIMGFGLIPVYTFFLLREKEEIKNRIVPLLPGRIRNDIIEIIRKIDLAISAFFRGRFIVCTICSMIMVVGLWIIGVKYGFLFGILIGISTVVPLLPLAFLAPALLVAYLAPGGSGYAVIWTLVLYFFMQVLEGGFFTPVILGKEVELHPVVLILSFLIGGQVLGFVGVLLAVPIASIIKILLAEFILPSVEEIAAEHRTTIVRERKEEAVESGQQTGKHDRQETKDQ